MTVVEEVVEVLQDVSIVTGEGMTSGAAGPGVDPWKDVVVGVVVDETIDVAVGVVAGVLEAGAAAVTLPVGPGLVRGAEEEQEGTGTAAGTRRSR